MRLRLTQTATSTIMALTAAAWIAGPAGAADIPEAHVVDKTPPSESADTLMDRKSYERDTEVNPVPDANLSSPEAAETTERHLNGESGQVPKAHRVGSTPPSESVDWPENRDGSS